jgi:hypothetical protein
VKGRLSFEMLFNLTIAHKYFSIQYMPIISLCYTLLVCREKNLDDVLQTTSIFSNVSKGILAKDKGTCT